jgi:hypothetical protein
MSMINVIIGRIMNPGMDDMFWPSTNKKIGTPAE